MQSRLFKELLVTEKSSEIGDFMERIYDDGPFYGVLLINNDHH